ncbi:MAG: helix-turn-helix domain-containing protein, partial [Pseudomonadota bacterium]
PLRSRKEDIPDLLDHYLAESARELAAPAKSLSKAALDLLKAYDWPGNVRQLVNATRRLTVTAPGSVITVDDIPEELGGPGASTETLRDWTIGLTDWAEQHLASGGRGLMTTATREMERTLIRLALDRTGGHRQKAAKLLGWGRNTLTRKIKSLEMD